MYVVKVVLRFGEDEEEWCETILSFASGIWMALEFSRPRYKLW